MSANTLKPYPFERKALAGLMPFAVDRYCQGREFVAGLNREAMLAMLPPGVAEPLADAPRPAVERAALTHYLAGFLVPSQEHPADSGEAGAAS